MGLPPGESAVKATIGLCSMHVPQESVSTHSQERDIGRTPCPQVGGETSALGQDAGTGAESGTSESLLWSFPSGAALPLPHLSGGWGLRGCAHHWHSWEELAGTGDKSI